MQNLLHIAGKKDLHEVIHNPLDAVIKIGTSDIGK
jgi:hypothetical protein